jgi:hypothetical protein
MKFCGECGAELTLACPSCSASNPPQFKFCGDCGHSLVPSEISHSQKDLSFDEKLAKIQRYLPSALKKAETMFREMDMDYWMRKAQ